MNYLLGYARVSRHEQREDHQVDALKAAGCDKVFIDRASGALDHRPQLDELLQQLRNGDTLVVWKLDRLGRSLRRLIELINELGERGVEFKSLTENIDTRSPAGKFLFHVMGAFAELERDLIRERTRNGLEAARARGRVGGRKPVLTAKDADFARKLYDSKEYTVAEIAKRLRIGRTTLYRYLGDRT